jgi:hypothetical protein
MGSTAGVRVLVVAGFSSSPQSPDRLCAHPASYPVGTGGSFPVVKAAGALN